MHKYEFLNLLKKAALAARELGGELLNLRGKGEFRVVVITLTQLLAQPAL